MFKNYLLTTLRNVRKNKLTTLINIFGLSIGISAAVIIGFIIQYDFSFDKYEPDGDRIYRIVTKGDGWNNEGVPVPLYGAVKDNVSGIEATALLLQYNDNAPKISIPKSQASASSVFRSQGSLVFADNNYFKLFPHQWITGNPASALNTAYNIVLTESRAGLYFPGISAAQLAGRTIMFNDTIPMTVTGVVKDVEANSDFKYNVFISLATATTSTFRETYNWNQWGNTNSNFQTLVKLAPGVRPEVTNRQILTIFRKHRTEPDDTRTICRLQPLSDVHYNPDFNGPVSLSTLNNLVLLVIFLLLLGAINFINLSTAQSVQRAKEIGIRKTLGSGKRNLIFQFLTETFFLTLLAMLLSVAISPLLLNVFAGFIPDGLKFSEVFNQPSVWLFLLALTLIVSILAGLYPAFVLSRFQPAKVLKNQVSDASGTTRTAWLRQWLMVFQFVIAQVFIIGVIVVDKQIHYSLKKDMGFSTNAIITIQLPFDFSHPNNNKFLFRDQLRTMPGIRGVSLGNQSPAMNGQMSSNIEFTEKGKDVKIDVDTRDGDTDYLSVYQIPIIAGRNIIPADTTNELLINETLAKQLGFAQPANAVGHFAAFGGTSLPIVGVMKDFHLASVRTAIRPLVYFPTPKQGWIMHVALPANTDAWQPTIAKIETMWKRLYPDVDFDYTFIDDKIRNFYQQDQQLSLLLTWSAGIAVGISCLGLLGLIIFITNQRTKEIGIRKVLGATVAQIITLLSGDFTKLIAVAFVISIPIAWWATHNWLRNFAYHTELSWWIFLISGVIMICAALVILSLRAGKAAMMNPVKSLRTE